MPPRRQRIKPEPANILGDYPTPAESAFTARTVTPKREFEEIDLTSDDESPAKSFKTQATEDEGYASRVADQQRRVQSVAFSPSPRPSNTFRHPQQATMVSAKPQGLEFVGRKVKYLVDAISDLRKYGLKHVVELPELVLVGDQSAGKSSLMSALTEVKLPRDLGICTKCPANIKTSPAAHWSCKISLMQEYKYSPTGHRITEGTVTKRNPFPPWVEQPLEEKEFMTTEDKNQLEEGIKWAQLALLNHDTDYRQFIPGTGVRALGSFEHERDIAEAKFSPNMISVEISGPGLSALSFYDLPGVFRSAPNPSDQYLVKVIENLAKKYIKHENALIIWTLAMKTDPSNSETGNIISQCGARDRCIGVLTNPDHVAARHTEYEKVMRGQAHWVGHGYFVTKQPGETSTLAGPHYHAQAREEEELFFDNNELWRHEWSEFRHRCGTTVIQKYLSQELAKQIQSSIPTLEEQIKGRKAVIEEKLRACPAPPAYDVRNVILRLLAEFSTDVRSIMDGDSIDMTTFQRDWSALADQFRDLIIHIKPTVTVSHVSDQIMQDIVEITDDDDEEDEPVPPRGRKRPTVDDQHQTPRKNMRADSATPTPQPSRFISPQSDTTLKREGGQMYPPPVPAPQFRRTKPRDNPFLGTPFAKFADLGKGRITIEMIHNTISNHVRPGLPGLINTKTHNQLCLQAVEKWRSPLGVFLDETFTKIKQVLHDILNTHLGKYEQTQLFRTARLELDEFINTHTDQQREVAEDLFKMELYKSFTINRTSIFDNEAKEYATLKTARRNSRAKQWVLHEQRTDPKKKFPADLPQDEKNRLMQKRISEVKDEKLDVDTFDRELRVAAYVRAYYLTAGIRFVDNICLSIYSKLFQNIRDNILLYLERKLDIDNPTDGNAVCRRLMEENDNVAKRRADLQLEKERLDGFSKRLTDLIRQINEPEMPQQFSPERNGLPISESSRRPDGSDESETVVNEESSGEGDLEDTIMVRP